MKDTYIHKAKETVSDPNILINLISKRSKQLKLNQKPLIESLERLNPEDVALREAIEKKISYELYEG